MLHYFLTLARTLGNERGQDMAEYALLLALVSVVVIAVVCSMTGGIDNAFNSMKSALVANRTL
jgi:Flp pilus assembly pilin Flp